ncbi:MAG: ATP-binding protein [Solimonas sp.]
MNDAVAELLLTTASEVGFRLARFSVYNWGTFDSKVWQIEPQCHNMLLTGDIGSGKSTLVDGLTTLLFPSHRVIYNKAAGAERQERTPYSYVRGAFGAVQDEDSRQSRGLYLRDERQYSVLLAHFHNAGYGLDVTLAQVWWLKRGERNPERFYVVATGVLDIATDFGDFGGNIQALRKRLRSRKDVTIEDSFERYAERFRRELGLSNAQALELFYQTVSLKSIHDLTDFVRNHMLEPTAADDVVERLLGDFDNLNAAHDAVVKAERQITQLRPIVELGRRFEAERTELLALRGDRDALSAWFAAKGTELLGARIDELTLEIAKRGERCTRLADDIAHNRNKETELVIAMRDAGGGRLEAMAREAADAERIRDERRQAAERYRALTDQLQLPVAANDHAFHGNRQASEKIVAELGEVRQQLDNQRIDLGVLLKESRLAHESVSQDIAALQSKKSNIERGLLELRTALCQLLEVEESRLPFAGELVEVRDTESAWEGAIERVLRGLSLALLVPDELYDRVARYVDRTQLKRRLVYYNASSPADLRRLPDLHPKSLVRKVSVRADSEHYGWLQRELTRRFDLACCEDLDEFRREPQALTMAGQSKGGPRHEKDDRFSIDDRSRYVMGWRVEAKLKALLQKRRDIETAAHAAAGDFNRLKTRVEQLDARRQAAQELLRFERYEAIHWQESARRVDSIRKDMEALRASSDQLRTLEAQLDELRDRLRELGNDEGREREERAKAQERKDKADEALVEAARTLDAFPQDQAAVHFPRLAAAVPEWLGHAALEVSQLAQLEKKAREYLTRAIDNADGRVSRAAQQLTKDMQTFRNDWRAETTDFDAAPEALPEYARMLERLERDDLPRHRDRFRRLLRENTIQGVAMLQARLTEQEEAIREKIDRINLSLRSVEYTPATYICLQPDRDPDVEVRDFRSEMTGILESTLGEDDPYSEARFLRVRALIERFRGRGDFLAEDQRWRGKVLDVRRWFRFAASEHWRADGKQKEYYPDTGGKSGGQKEKLAYTVLAAGLAYQFGLEWGESRSRSFRFVVIDEAFGRGSEESTRYGLELFARLKLQLLIVTPLQKINVIEDYIRSVAFTHKNVQADGERSAVRNLTIEEYRSEKARHFGIAAA